jgi:hypothetical protein
VDNLAMSIKEQIRLHKQEKKQPGTKDPLLGAGDPTSKLKPRQYAKTVEYTLSEADRKNARRTVENGKPTTVPERSPRETQELDASEIIESVDSEEADEITPPPVSVPIVPTETSSKGTGQLDLDDEEVEVSFKTITDETGTKTWEDMSIEERVEVLYDKTSSAIGILQVLPEELKAEITQTVLELLRAALANEDRNDVEKRITQQFSITGRDTKVNSHKVHDLFKQIEGIKRLLNKSVPIDLMTKVEDLTREVEELKNKQLSADNQPKSFFKRLFGK